MCLSIRLDANERVHIGHGVCRVMATANPEDGQRRDLRRLRTRDAGPSRIASGIAGPVGTTPEFDRTNLPAVGLSGCCDEGLGSTPLRRACVRVRACVPRSCSGHQSPSGSSRHRTSGSGLPTRRRMFEAAVEASRRDLNAKQQRIRSLTSTECSMQRSRHHAGP